MNLLEKLRMFALIFCFAGSTYSGCAVRTKPAETANGNAEAADGNREKETRAPEKQKKKQKKKQKSPPPPPPISY